MGKSTAVTGLKFAQPTGQPLLISGTPGQLQGRLAIVNESPKKYTFRSAPFQSDRLLGAGRGELTEVKVISRIQAHQSGVLYFDIPIDPATPAGRYEASIQVGDQHQPIQVQVFEEVALHVLPDSVTLISDGELSFDREFMVENRGNVTLSLGSRSDARLFESGGPTGFQLTEKLNACAPEEESPCIVSLMYKDKDVTLQPGEQRIVAATVKIPGDLRPYRHYRADLQLLTAHIELNLYMRGASPVVR